MGAAVPRFVRLTTVLFAMHLAGCAVDHARDDAFAAPDAPTGIGDGGCIVPLGPEGWVSSEVGACLGFAEPTCAGCHLRDDGYVVRPPGIPPLDVVLPPVEGRCAICP